MLMWNCLDGPDLPQINVTAYSAIERGYSILENGTIILMCQASSKPPSQYVWFHNNSEISNGPQLTITKILRMQAGNYTCMAKNPDLNTNTRNFINLTVYCEWHVFILISIIKQLHIGNNFTI